MDLKWYIGIGALVLVSAVAGMYFLGFIGFKDEYQIYTARIGDAPPVSVEIARTEAERNRGLSGRESLLERTGLLFVFRDNAQTGIWMKGMLFSIDILWMDAEGKIIHMEKSVSPDTFPKIFIPPTPARYVLELEAGFLDTYDVTIGDIVSFPQPIGA